MIDVAPSNFISPDFLGGVPIGLEAFREASRRKWREDTIAAMAVLDAEHPAAIYRRRAA